MLDLDGSVETDNFDRITTGFNNSVNAIAVHTVLNSTNLAVDNNLLGSIVVGGAFTTYNGVNHSRVVRLNPDGSIDTSFNVGSGTDNPVFAIAIQNDNKIIIAGDFTEVNGTPRNRIARLWPNGVVDDTFDPGEGANGVIRSVTIDPANGQIYIGGDFTGYNFVTQQRIARLQQDGTLDADFITIGNPLAPHDPGDLDSGADARIRSVALDSAKRVVVAGDFNIIGGSTNFAKIARLLPSGDIDTSFAVSPGADAAVFAVEIDDSDRIVMAGDFTQVNGKNRIRIARLRSDGSLDPSINFGTGPNNFVASLALQSVTDGAITIGGGFTEVDGLTKNYVSQLVGGVNTGPGSISFVSINFVVTESVVNAIVTLRRSGGLENRVLIDYSTFDGTAFSSTNASASITNFSAAAGTLTFSEAEATESYVVVIQNDGETNANRAFSNILSNPLNDDPSAGLVPFPGLLGEVTNATMTIVNDDGEIGFPITSYTVNELSAGSNAVITVSRTGSTVGAVSVSYSVADGVTNSAVAGLDYIPVSGQVTIADGETSATFLVPILDDNLVEGAETLTLTLTNATPNTLARLGRSSAQLTIVDNDFSPGEFRFDQAAYTVTEGEGVSLATITVLRSNGFSGLVTVQYNTVDVNAKGWNGLGSSNTFDYTLTQGTLTFADGELQKSFQIPIIGNQIADTIANRLVRIELNNITGGGVISTPDVLFGDQGQ